MESGKIVGVFVPWDATRKSKQSAKVGWITDANGCDIWQGYRTDEGYPVVRNEGRTCLAHRVRYEREVGSIPEGLPLDHYICDNGAGGCCNPLHCRPVTPRENALRSRGITSACAAKTRCPKGHPLSGNNLVQSTLARGIRRCVKCRDALNRATYLARKARAA